MMVAGSTILLHGHSIINPWGVVGGWSCLLLGAGAVRWALGEVGGWGVDRRWTDSSPAPTGKNRP